MHSMSKGLMAVNGNHVGKKKTGSYAAVSTPCALPTSEKGRQEYSSNTSLYISYASSLKKQKPGQQLDISKQPLSNKKKKEVENHLLEAGIYNSSHSHSVNLKKKNKKRLFIYISKSSF